jgi:PAS domain S-box-containing protein
VLNGQAEAEKNNIQSFIDVLSGFVSIQDADYTIVFQNKFNTDTGGNRVGQKCFSAYHGRDTVCPRCPVARSFKDGRGHIHRMKTKTSTGNTIFLEHLANPIKDASGKVTLVLELSGDITGRKRAEAALKESEAFNASLLENAPNPILVTNLDGSIRYVNQATVNLTGFSREEIVGGKEPYPWWPKEKWKDYENSNLMTRKLASPNVERYYHKKNGEKFWVVINIKTVTENRKAKYYLSNWVNISDRKKAEANLELVNTMLRAIRNINQLITQTNDPQQLLQFVCRSLVETRGFIGCRAIQLDSDEHMLFSAQYGIESVLEVKEGVKPQRLPQCARLALDEGRAIVVTDTFECGECKFREDNKIHSTIMVAPMKYNERTMGMLISIPGENIEINEEEFELFQELAIDLGFALYNIELEKTKSEMKKQLEESEARFRAIVEASPMAVILFSGLSEKLEYINPRYTEIFGYTQEDIPDMSNWWAKAYSDPVLRAKYAAQWNKRVGTVLQTGQPSKPVEREIICKDGSKKIVELVEAPLGSKRATFITDLTERKRILESFRGLYAKEKAQRQELEDEAKARGLFINILCHELRTPLTPIIVSASLLKDSFRQDPGSIQNELINNIYGNSQALVRRLEELLDFARFARGEASLKVESLDTAEFIKEVVSRFQPVIQKKKQNLIFELNENLPRIEVDPSRLEQVLANLLSNASKFSKEGKKIILRSKVMANQVLIEVQDEGIGISPEEQGWLFQPYHRVEQDRRKFPGLGLGLAISKQIVEAHKGKLWFTSKVNHGSTFSFLLPVKRPER